MYCGCCYPDVPGMIIQYRMLMMADQSSGRNFFQTPSPRLRRVSERANIWFPSYQDAWKLLIDQFIETRLCKLGWHWATDLLFVWMGSHRLGGSQAVHHEGYWPVYSGYYSILDGVDWGRWSQTHESSFPCSCSETRWTFDTTMDLHLTSIECIWVVPEDRLDIDGWAHSSYQSVLFDCRHQRSIKREHGLYGRSISMNLSMKNGKACVDSLMNGHWEELFGKLEELLHATDHPDDYCTSN